MRLGMEPAQLEQGQRMTALDKDQMFVAAATVVRLEHQQQKVKVHQHSEQHEVDSNLRRSKNNIEFCNQEYILFLLVQQHLKYKQFSYLFEIFVGVK